jgi:signal transduction histidine kinase
MMSARRSVRALRPRLLETGDLVDAIEATVRALTEGTGIEAEVRAKGRRRRLAELVESNLLRAAQEAVTNAVRHAECRSIQVEIALSRTSVGMKIDDDGRGLSEAEASAGAGMGLRSMRERVEQIGGKITFGPGPRGGTRVEIRGRFPKGLLGDTWNR